MENELRSMAIKDAFEQCEVVNTTGKLRGSVLISPNLVANNFKTTKQNLFAPRYRFEFQPQSRKTLWEFTASYNSKRYHVGIFEGKLEFPDKCTVCLGKPTNYRVVELSHKVGSVPLGVLGNLHVDGISTDAEKRSKLDCAWNNRRYWYAIPMCENHQDRVAVLAGSIKEQYFFNFFNQEYGYEFGQLNSIAGKWMNRVEVYKDNIVTLIAILAAIWLVISIFVRSMSSVIPIGILVMYAAVYLYLLISEREKDLSDSEK
jgi:hypothetical protein